MKQTTHRFMVLAALVFNYSACCRSLPPQPNRPITVKGWSHADTRTGFHAELLLRKGESSENGKIGVRVVEISEGEPCGDVGFAIHRRATLQFYNPADGRVLCEESVTAQSNSRIHCEAALGVGIIAGRAINTAEGWMLFELRR